MISAPRRGLFADAGAFSIGAFALLAYLFRDALLRGYVLGQADFLTGLLPWQPYKPVVESLSSSKSQSTFATSSRDSRKNR